MGHRHPSPLNSPNHRGGNYEADGIPADDLGNHGDAAHHRLRRRANGRTANRRASPRRPDRSAGPVPCPDRNPSTNGRARTLPDADSNTHAHAHAHANRHSPADGHTRTDSGAHAHAHADPNTHADAVTHPYPDAYAYAVTHPSPSPSPTPAPTPSPTPSPTHTPPAAATAAPEPPPTLSVVESDATFLSYEDGVLAFRRGYDTLTVARGPDSGPGVRVKIGPRYTRLAPEDIPTGASVILYTLTQDGVETILSVVYIQPATPTPPPTSTPAHPPTPTKPSSGSNQLSFVLTPPTGSPGDLITVTSTNFPEDDPNWMIVIYTQDIVYELFPPEAEPGPGGSLSVEFVVPQMPSGQYTFLLFAANTLVSAVGQFAVINGVNVTPTPRPTRPPLPTATPVLPRISLQFGPQGTPGDSVFIDGRNFPGDVLISRVEFSGFGEVELLPTPDGPVRTRPGGSFTAVAIVPDVDPGRYTITVFVGSGRGQVTATHPFDVLP